MSSCEAPDRFWFQNEATFKQLSRLNSDIGRFVDRFEQMNTLVATVTEASSGDSANTELKQFAQRTSSFATLIDPEKSLALGEIEEALPNSRIQPLRALFKQFASIFIK